MIENGRLQQILARLRANFAGETVDWQAASPQVLFLGVLHEIASEIETAVAADQVHQTVLTENPSLLALRGFLDKGLSAAPQAGTVLATFSALIPVSSAASNDIEFSPRIEPGTSFAGDDGSSCTVLNAFNFEIGTPVEHVEGQQEPLALGELGIDPTSVTLDGQAFQIRHRTVRCAVAAPASTTKTIELAGTSRAPLLLSIEGAFRTVHAADSAGTSYERISRWSAAQHPHVYLEFYDATNDRLYLLFSNGDVARRPKQGETLTLRYLRTSTLVDSTPGAGNVSRVYAAELPSLDSPLTSTQRGAFNTSNQSLDVGRIQKGSGPRMYEGADLTQEITRPITQHAAGPLLSSDIRAAVQHELSWSIADMSWDNRKQILHVWKQGSAGRIHTPVQHELEELLQQLRKAQHHGMSFELRPGKVLEAIITISRVPGKSVGTFAVRTKLSEARAMDPQLLDLSSVNEPHVTGLAVSFLGEQGSTHTSLVRWLSPQVLSFDSSARYNIAAVKVN